MTTLTTGKTVVLSDGQFQTECTIDDGAKPFTDHLSYQPGSDPVAALTARARQRMAQQDAVTKPPALIPPNTVIDLAPPIVVPPTPPADATDRATFNAEMVAALQALTLAKLPPSTRAKYRPEWAVDIPVTT